MATNSSRMTVESSSIYGDKNVGQLNRAHLKFAVSHVSSLSTFNVSAALWLLLSISSTLQIIGIIISLYFIRM